MVIRARVLLRSVHGIVVGAKLVVVLRDLCGPVFGGKRIETTKI